MSLTGGSVSEAGNSPDEAANRERRSRCDEQPRPGIWKQETGIQHSPRFNFAACLARVSAFGGTRPICPCDARLDYLN